MPDGLSRRSKSTLPKKNALFCDDRPADAAAELLMLELARSACGSMPSPTEVLVAAEEIAGAVELVRAALGDRVDAAAGEAALPDVVRRDHELQLLDRVEADRLRFRLAAGRARRRQAEHVVVDGAVDLHVVVAVVAAGDRDEPADLR